MNLETNGRNKSSPGILIVDDEVELLKTLQIMINLFGYKSYVATSGKEALEVFNKNKSSIHMMLIDYLMPNMNGMELLRYLFEAGANNPIFISSGNLTEKMEVDFLRSGASGFLSKPYTANVLKTLLENNLNKKDS